MGTKKRDKHTKFAPTVCVLNDVDETILELSVRGETIKKYGRKIFRPYIVIRNL